MIVTGVMIGSGIFIVPADMARTIQSPGWLLVAWVFTGVLTISAALSFGELSSMMPGAGGMYLYLSEAYSPLWGFLYGWTFFTVIQTGSIAAVAVAFSRFSGVLIPWISESQYLVHPIRLFTYYAISLSTSQLVSLVVIVLLTACNTFGIEYVCVDGSFGCFAEQCFKFGKELFDGVEVGRVGRQIEQGCAGRTDRFLNT